jgi:hypothetical protein
MSNRLNDEQSAIVIIMQRLHEGDVSGDILAREANYCHLMIPMYFDPLRYPASEDGLRTEDPETGEEYTGNEIGWIDPRASNEAGEALSPWELAENDGVLAWEARFPGRRIGCGWRVSCVALAMYLDGNKMALAEYHAGARALSERVAAYYRRFGLGDLLKRPEFSTGATRRS